MKRIIFALLAILLLLGQQRTMMVADEVQQAPSCLFFTEAATEGGFSVCDDGQARFRSAFEQWGLQNIGYPISRRYVYDGFVTQAFQKALMQWRTDGEYVALINIFDDLHHNGSDGSLFVFRQTPYQLPAGWDGDIPFNEVIKKRQALLNERTALRDTYFASPDPLRLYGLPTSLVTDMGNHYAIRLQRTVLQEWKEDVPWARAGQVTVANGGDIAKEFSLLPAQPLIPENQPSSDLRQLDLVLYRGDSLHYSPVTWQTSTLNHDLAALKHNTIDECTILEQGPTHFGGQFESKKVGQITYNVYPAFNPGLNRPSSDINKLYVARPDFQPLLIVSGPTDKWAQCEADGEAVLATLQLLGGGSGLNTEGTIMGGLSRNRPPSGMKIYAFRVDLDLYYYIDSEKGANSYAIDVAPGTYEVIAYADNYSPMAYWQKNEWGGYLKLGAVTVEPGESVAGINLSSSFAAPRTYPLLASALRQQDLPRDPFGAIYGELPSSAGRPLRVYAQNVNHEAITYITDVNVGEKFYRLLLPAGDYKLFAYTHDGHFAGSYRFNNQNLAVVTVKAGERRTQINVQTEGPNVPQPSVAPLDASLSKLSLRHSPLTLSYNASEWELTENPDNSNLIYSSLNHKTIAGCQLIHDLVATEVGGHILKTITGPITFDLYSSQSFGPTENQRTVLYQAHNDQFDGIDAPPVKVSAPTDKWERCQVAAHGVLATLRLDP